MEKKETLINIFLQFAFHFCIVASSQSPVLFQVEDFVVEGIKVVGFLGKNENVLGQTNTHSVFPELQNAPTKLTFLS